MRVMATRVKFKIEDEISYPFLLLLFSKLRICSLLLISGEVLNSIVAFSLKTRPCPSLDNENPFHT